MKENRITFEKGDTENYNSDEIPLYICIFAFKYKILSLYAWLTGHTVVLKNVFFLYMFVSVYKIA